MPLPPEPSILDELWPRLPEGNPDDVMARLAQWRLERAIEALPPVTRLPLVPWPPQDETIDNLATQDRVALAAQYCRLDPSDRMRWLETVVAELGEGGTTAWREEAPHDPVGMLLRALQLQRTAWASHDAAEAETDEFAAMTFDTFLEWSRELCEEAAALLPEDPTPWVVAQRTTPSDAEAIWATSLRWQSLDKENLSGHMALHSQLAPPLFGATERLDVARAVSEAAAPGSPLHLLVPYALVAAYADLTVAGEAPAEADRVFVEGAAALDAAHARSVGSPAWRRTWLEGDARNMFAFCAFFGNLDQLAWSEIRATQGHLTHPWTLKSSDGVAAYELARAWLLRHVVKP